MAFVSQVLIPAGLFLIGLACFMAIKEDNQGQHFETNGIRVWSRRRNIEKY